MVNIWMVNMDDEYLDSDGYGDEYEGEYCSGYGMFFYIYFVYHILSQT